MKYILLAYCLTKRIAMAVCVLLGLFVNSMEWTLVVLHWLLSYLHLECSLLRPRFCQARLPWRRPSWPSVAGTLAVSRERFSSQHSVHWLDGRLLLRWGMTLKCEMGNAKCRIVVWSKEWHGDGGGSNTTVWFNHEDGDRICGVLAVK